MFSRLVRGAALVNRPCFVINNNNNNVFIINNNNIISHFNSSLSSLTLTRRHFATKPVKGNAPPPRTPKSSPKPTSTNATVVSRPTPTAKHGPTTPSASALAAKKVVDEIIADSDRYRRDDDDDDDDDDNDDADQEPEITREELLKRSKAGFDAATIIQLRNWLPRDGTPVTAAVAAQCAKLLNRTSEEHLDVVNLPVMYLCRIISETKWHVFTSPTKQGVLLAFSSLEAAQAFVPALPKDQFEVMAGYDIGAAIVADDDNSIKGVAFDPAGIQRLKPTFKESRLMLLLHWSDSIFFEQFVAAADPNAPLLMPDPDDADAYDPRVLWHRPYVIGALGGDGPDAKPEDVQLMSDSEDRIVLFAAPDHVAEAVADGRVLPVSLSAEEVIGVLETQKVGVSITIGADCDTDDKPTRHKSVVWTNEQALSIFRGSRPKKGEEGYEELMQMQAQEEREAVKEAEVIEAEPAQSTEQQSGAEKPTKIVQRREKPSKPRGK
jgi:hypothetical protein